MEVSFDYAAFDAWLEPARTWVETHEALLGLIDVILLTYIGLFLFRLYHPEASDREALMERFTEWFRRVFNVDVEDHLHPGIHSITEDFFGAEYQSIIEFDEYGTWTMTRRRRWGNHWRTFSAYANWFEVPPAPLPVRLKMWYRWIVADYDFLTPSDVRALAPSGLRTLRNQQSVEIQSEIIESPVLPAWQTGREPMIGGKG